MSTEAQRPCFPACCLCLCCCSEQGKPLEHQTSLSCFFYSKWQCLYNTRNLKPSPAHSTEGASILLTSPASYTAVGHQATPLPPAWEAKRGHTEASGVGGKRKREGVMQRDRKGQGSQVPSCSLSGTNEIHVKCSMIKKQMIQCRAVFRRFVLQLQMAPSRRSHQPVLHSHMPPFRKTHTHIHK